MTATPASSPTTTASFTTTASSATTASSSSSSSSNTLLDEVILVLESAGLGSIDLIDLGCEFFSLGTHILGLTKDCFLNRFGELDRDLIHKNLVQKLDLFSASWTLELDSVHLAHARVTNAIVARTQTIGIERIRDASSNCLRATGTVQRTKPCVWKLR
jgi:hypothetical protein